MNRGQLPLPLRQTPDAEPVTMEGLSGTGMSPSALLFEAEFYYSSQFDNFAMLNIYVFVGEICQEKNLSLSVHLNGFYLVVSFLGTIFLGTNLD